MVQVLHLGQEFTPPVTWERLVQRMRARAPRIQGEQRVAISDTNIVIQSPNTVIDSPAPARSPDVDLITLWDIEMPPPSAGHVPDATRDSQYAAAAAIAILARGDDASLMSRTYRPQLRPPTERSGNTRVDESRPSENSSRHDYVTTDVTYTTPSINPDMQHHLSTRTSNVTQTQPPTNQVFADTPELTEDIVIDQQEEDDEEDDDDDSSDDAIIEDHEEEEGQDDDEETEIEIDRGGPIEEIEQVEVEQNEDPPLDDQEVEAQPEQVLQETKESEFPVIEGPSEGKILIKLKFMNDTEKNTYASLEDTVAKFKVDHFTNLANQVIRLIYQGQLLREDHRTLEEYGLQPGSIVHCHISTTPYTRPGIATLPPIVNNGFRRRPRRSVRAPRDTTPMPSESVPVVDENVTTARRRAAQDRNVGQIYLLLSTMVPILSGIGLAFFRPDRIRDLLRPATLLTISQWVCNLLVDNGLLEQDDDDQETHLQTSTLFWIFGGQMVAVSIFLYYFPDVFDRVGFSIFIIVFLYFVFVVYSRQRRRQPDPVEVQNEMMENQIVQETIRLL